MYIPSEGILTDCWKKQRQAYPFSQYQNQSLSPQLKRSQQNICVFGKFIDVQSC